MAAIERYSSSAEDLKIVTSFLVFHEIGERPKKTNQPDRERLVRGQLAQSESHHPLNAKSQSERNKIP